MVSDNDILIQFLEGQLNAEEVLLLEKRLLEDPELSMELSLLKEIYQVAADYDYPERALTETSLNQLRTQMHPLKKVFSIRRISTIAASILMFALLGYGIFSIVEQNKTEEISSGSLTKLIELEDGSSLILNPGASIRYASHDFESNRNITAKGDITYLIQKDIKHPFVIEYEGFEIKVTGTRFRVKNSGLNHYVTLFSGKLEVKSVDQVFKLRPGETLEGHNIWQRSEANLPDNSNSYYPLEFANVPLNEVIRNIEKRFDLNIQYPPHLKNVRYTLNAEGLSKEDVLLILTELTSTTVEEHSGFIELKQ